MNARFLALAALLALAGCGDTHEPSPNELAVSDAKVRLPAVEGQPGAAYFTLHGGRSGDRLEAVSSEQAASIELHENRMVNGMMTMQPLTGIDVPAGTKSVFEPGGNHAMLYGLDPAVKPGGTLKLRFTFQSGKTLDVAATTFAAGDELPGGGHGGH